MKTTIKAIAASLLLSVAFSSASAWDRGVSLGGGYGNDINHHTYTNSGGILTAELMSLKSNTWYNITMNGSLGQWHTTEPLYRDLTTVALTFAFRAYVFYTNDVHPFLIVSSGPAYISNRSFGYNSQGANVDFQTSGGVGFELGTAKRAEITAQIIHFSNAYTFHPNQGFNIVPVLTLGCLF